MISQLLLLRHQRAKIMLAASGSQLVEVSKLQQQQQSRDPQAVINLWSSLEVWVSAAIFNLLVKHVQSDQSSSTVWKVCKVQVESKHHRVH